MPQLECLTVRGFKSIRALEDFELRNLSILVGANGAGKSNFIDLFRMLADTHPSALLRRLLRPRYTKILHGSAVSASIGLDRIRAECRHFDKWLSRVETLPPLRQVR